ncbi:MAG: TetR/AcrR family transcriptional regulator [Novosphingobium sp.]
MARTYHHGDLRSALIAAGKAALESGEPGQISLRQLAREAGVSPTAVYRHFPDKDALLSALAAEGIEDMARWQQDAASRATPESAFAATGRAYVRWGLANPTMFRLVFGQCNEVARTVFGDNTAAHLLRTFALDRSASEEEVQTFMLQAWSLVHGLTMLILDGQLPNDDAVIDRVIDTTALFRI